MLGSDVDSGNDLTYWLFNLPCCSMNSAQFKPFTADDYFAIPEEGSKYQLIHGDLLVSPSPSTFHQLIITRLFIRLGCYVESRNIGTLFVAPFDVELSDFDVYQPDICFFSNARKHCIRKQGAKGAPDLIVEVLSPATAERDKGMKRRIYAKSGVDEMWIIDPEVSNLTLYRFRENPEFPVKVYLHTEKFSSPVFPELEIDLTQVLNQE